MQVTIGDKVNQPLPDGRTHPAITATKQTTTIQTVIDRKTGLPVDIEVTRADFYSLRTRLDGTKYLAYTNEVVMFGFKIVATPRFSNVIGLDIDEDGTFRTLEEISEEHAKTHGEWAAEQYDSRTTSIADLKAR